MAATRWIEQRRQFITRVLSKQGVCFTQHFRSLIMGSARHRQSFRQLIDALTVILLSGPKKDNLLDCFIQLS